MVNIEERLVKELGITLKQVQNVIKLLDEVGIDSEKANRRRSTDGTRSYGHI